MTARPSRRNAWLLIALFGGGFALFVWFLISSRASPLSVETHLREQPGMAATLTAFQDGYPRHYTAFMNDLAAIANAQGETVAYDEATPSLRRFIAAKSGLIANAPAPELARLATGTRDLILALQQHDAELCAQFVTRGTMDRARMPEAVTEQVGQVNALLIRAAARAEQGAAATRPPLGPQDGAAWYLAIRGVDPTLADAINSGARDEDATPAHLCQRGATLWRAAAALPEAQAANVTAHLVRQSFGPAAPQAPGSAPAL